MLRTVLVFILLFFPLFAQAQSISKHAAHCAVSGACQLKGQGDFQTQRYPSRFKAKNIFLSMNPYMDGELRLYQRNDGQAIAGEFVLDNHAKKPVLLKYQVIFKDAKGSIAKTTGHVLLKQGNRRKINFSDIMLSQSDLKNIFSYEIVLNKVSMH